MPELSASEELKRLVGLPTADFLKEFSQIREKFKDFLKANNIAVPSISIDETPGAKAPPADNAILLDSFSAETIGGIDKNILSVYGTAQAFLDLFSTLPNSTLLDSISVKPEGKDPLTAKDLQEQCRMGSFPQDSQIIVASSDLRSLLPELQGKKPQAQPPPPKETEVANLDPSDLESIFAEPPPVPASAETPASPATEAPAAPGAEEPLKKLSPLVSQEEYDALFLSPVNAEAAVQEEPAEHKEEAIAQVEIPPSPTPETPGNGNAELSQKELDALFVGNKPEAPASAAPVAQEASTESVSPDKSALSQDELDALFAGGKSASTETAPETSTANVNGNLALAQEELDALFAGKAAAPKSPEPPVPAATPDTGNGNLSLSQEELDALFAKPVTPSAPVAAKPAKDNSLLSQEDLDALFTGGKGSDTVQPEPEATSTEIANLSLSQEELDALFSASPATAAPASPVPARETAKAANESTLSQEDLDALFNSNQNPAPAPELPAVEEELKGKDVSLSQEELDALLSAKEPLEEKTETIPESSGKDASKTPEISYSIGNAPDSLSKEELEKMFS
ncbi:MAG: hypothetical protein A2X49_17280 [Lentisphaerae bacterium GWF2_52_8]|nr:MAG: hypothetical protein A2X49_17280 [Lentisphaerae bacterium GWF2_52_8]